MEGSASKPPSPAGSAVTALTTLAGYYRMPADPGSLRNSVGSEAEGTHLINLLRTTQSLGFDVQAATLTWEMLGTARFPLIARFLSENSHASYGVVSRTVSDAVVLVAPGQVPVRVNRAEFLKRWTGWVLMAAPRTRTTSPPTRPF